MHRAFLTAVLVLFSTAAWSREVVYQFDTPTGPTCTKAQESMDVQGELAKGRQLTGSASMESVCRCKEDGAGKCRKDESGNEMWWATIQLVK